MLKSKCILADKQASDGKRISIMSRHTLSDGKTPDSRITPDCFDEHKPELGPSPKLVGKYYRQEIDFSEYKKLYKQELSNKSDLLETLIQESTQNDITVLCIEADPTYCHRKILIETIQNLAKTLGIDMDIEIK